MTTTGPGSVFGLDLAEIFERGEEPRHADGKSGRRHRLAAKARHQAVIAPAAADRAEARRAVGAVGGEGQFNFEDRAGVIFEAADDGGIDDEFGRPNIPTLRSADI